MEQPQYNLFERRKVEQEYARLYEDIGLGLTTWSPLASGLLTGKYREGVPEGSRAALPGYEWLKDCLTNERRNEQVASLQEVADQLDCTLAQLAIAWCAGNPHVSTVITGASRPEQVVENLGALDVLDKLTDEVVADMGAHRRALARHQTPASRPAARAPSSRRRGEVLVGDVAGDHERGDLRHRSPVRIRSRSRTAPVGSLAPLATAVHGMPGRTSGTSSNHG